MFCESLSCVSSLNNSIDLEVYLLIFTSSFKRWLCNSGEWATTWLSYPALTERLKQFHHICVDLNCLLFLLRSSLLNFLIYFRFSIWEKAWIDSIHYCIQKTLSHVCSWLIRQVAEQKFRVVHQFENFWNCQDLFDATHQS